MVTINPSLNTISSKLMDCGDYAKMQILPELREKKKKKLFAQITDGLSARWAAG